MKFFTVSAITGLASALMMSPAMALNAKLTNYTSVCVCLKADAVLVGQHGSWACAEPGGKATSRTAGDVAIKKVKYEFRDAPSCKNHKAARLLLKSSSTPSSSQLQNLKNQEYRAFTRDAKSGGVEFAFERFADYK